MVTKIVQVVLLVPRTEGGASCGWYPCQDNTGWKVYRSEDEALKAMQVQCWLHKHKLAPAILSPFIEFMEYRSDSTLGWGYLSEKVDVAGKVWEGSRHSMRATGEKTSEEPAFVDWKEVDTLLSKADSDLRKEVRGLFNIADDSTNFDMHRFNWGFGANSRPVVLDTGYHFYRDIPKERQAEILGETCSDERENRGAYTYTYTNKKEGDTEVVADVVAGIRENNTLFSVALINATV